MNESQKTRELLNKSIVAVVVGQTAHQPDHGALLAALRDRYPGWEFNLVAAYDEWRSVSKKLLFNDGTVISDDFESWLTAEVEAAGSPRALWEKYKDAGLVLGEQQGYTIYVTAPYGPEPDAFFQVEVNASHEVTGRYAFDDGFWFTPNSLRDLLEPMTDLPPEKELSPWRYELRQVIDIRRFVREMTEGAQGQHESSPAKGFLRRVYPECSWPVWQHPIARLFRDWQESSAGRAGHLFCRHWCLQTSDYTDRTGERHMSAIPRWADADGGLDLPEIHPDQAADSIATYKSLSEFDRQLAYPFAWYFYMLHGNRVSSSAAYAVILDLDVAKRLLPDHDERVLLRWYGLPYGF